MTEGIARDDVLLREAREAERALIEAETRAEAALVDAEARYRRSLEKLARAQAKVEERRRAFEHARSLLDQAQLERAAGPLIRRLAVDRPSLPRPARDDSRARSRKRTEPVPEGTGSDDDSSK
jgi:hypothetical protein